MYGVNQHSNTTQYVSILSCKTSSLGLWIFSSFTQRGNGTREGGGVVGECLCVLFCFVFLGRGDVNIKTKA